MQWGRSCYVPMLPWKDFLMGQIRKIQKREERGRSGEFKKTRRKEWRKEKEEIFYVCEGSHICVFSIVREHPGSTALMRPSLRRTHSYGNLPYNKIPYQHRGQNWSAWKGDCCLLQPAQISAVVVGPSFMLVNFSRTNQWGLWQKYVSLCFENQ